MGPHMDGYGSMIDEFTWAQARTPLHVPQNPPPPTAHVPHTTCSDITVDEITYCGVLDCTAASLMAHISFPVDERSISKRHRRFIFQSVCRYFGCTLSFKAVPHVRFKDSTPDTMFASLCSYLLVRTTNLFLLFCCCVLYEGMARVMRTRGAD